MGLFLVVVLVVVTVLAAPAATTTTPLFHLLRRLDGVRQLLQGQADAPLVGVHTNDQQRQLVADADQLVGPADRAVGHLRDVEQPVHAGLQLDERAEVGEAHDLPGDSRAHRVALRDRGPRIGLDLLEPERDPLGGAVDLEHDHFDLVADVDELGGVSHAPRPGHLGDVDETFHAGLELDERTVVGEAHDLAPRLGTGRVRLLDALPGVRRLLLVAERHTARFAVEVEDHDLDVVTDLEDLRGVADAAPAHVGHVQEPVDPTEVDERAIVRNVLDGAREHHALGQHLERVLLLLLALLLEDRAAREHDVAAAAVELDDLGPNRLADHGGQILHRAQVHLGARQERLDPDVDREAALDDLDHAAFHRRALLVGLGDRVPDLDLVGLVLGENDEPFGVLFGFEVHLDLFADLRQGAVPVEFLDRDRPFALVADVDEDLAGADVDHAAADDLSFLELGHAVVIPVLHALLGRLSALPARCAAVLPWFVLLHAIRSSRHFICFPPRTTRTSASHRPPCYRPGAARSPPPSRGWRPRSGACDRLRARPRI